MTPQRQQPGHFTAVTDVIAASARRLEPLLVLAFSVERMIAVCYPFLVRTAAAVRPPSYDRTETFSGVSKAVPLYPQIVMHCTSNLTDRTASSTSSPTGPVNT